MSPLLSDDSFRAHRVHESVANAGVALEAALGSPQNAAALGRDGALLRAGTALPYIQAKLSRVVPVLVDSAALDGMADSVEELSTVLGRVQTPDSTGEDFAQVESLVLRILKQCASLPLVLESLDAEALYQGIDRARRKVAGSLAAFTKQSGVVREELATLRATQKALQATIESSSAQLTQKVAATEQRLDAMVTDQQQRFTESQASQSEKFLAASEGRQTEHKDQLIEMRGEVEALAEELSEKSTALISKVKADTESALSEIKANASALAQKLTQEHDKAVALVGIIGSTGMTGAYQQQANQARREKYVWSVVTVGSFLLLVQLLLDRFDAAAEFSWGVLAVRIVVAATLLGLAGFAGIEARRAGDAERKYRRMELELASIGPFLADFPEDESRKIRQNLAERVFGVPDAQSPDSAIGTGVGAAEILKAVAQWVSKQK